MMLRGFLVPPCSFLDFSPDQPKLQDESQSTQDLWPLLHMSMALVYGTPKSTCALKSADKIVSDATSGSKTCVWLIVFRMFCNDWLNV